MAKVLRGEIKGVVFGSPNVFSIIFLDEKTQEKKTNFPEFFQNFSGTKTLDKLWNFQIIFQKFSGIFLEIFWKFQISSRNIPKIFLEKRGVLWSII